MQTYQELKSLTKQELLKELAQARFVLLEKKMTVKTRHQKDTSSVSKQKKYVAQICTALKDLELEELIKAATKIN